MAAIASNGRGGNMLYLSFHSRLKAFSQLLLLLLLSACFFKRSSDTSTDAGTSSGSGSGTGAGEAAPPSATAVSALASAATVTSGATYNIGSASVELSSAGSQTASDTGTLGCSGHFQPAALANFDGTHYFYKPSKSFTSTGVALGLSQSGVTTGDLVVRIYQGLTLLRQTLVNANSLTGSVTSTAFNWTSPLDLTAGTTYYVNFFVSGTNTSGVQYSTNITGCSKSGEFSENNDSVIPTASNTPIYTYTSVLGAAYNASNPTASFVVDGGAIGTFYPSAFAVTESGVVTYDIGSSNSATPTYSLLGLTKAQVIARDSMAGRYFFVRATLENPDSFTKSSVGNVSLTFK